MFDKEFSKPDPKLRELYPYLTAEELSEAEQNLEAYLQVVARIYKRIISDPEAYKKFKKLLAAEKDLSS